MKHQIFGLSIIFCIWFTLFSPGSVICQSDTDEKSKANDLLWIDIYPHFYVSEKLEYYGDGGYRTNLNKNIWHWVYARPSVRYHIDKHWELHGGVGFFYIFNNVTSDRFEIRPWQGIRVSWPRFETIGFKHYARFEQRIYFFTDDRSSRLDLRLRYKISCRWDFLKINKRQFWFIPLYVELFFPVGEEDKGFFRDRGRAGVGLGYNPSAVWRFSLNYNWHTLRSGVEDDFDVTDIVYQIKVRKYLNID